jgi:hypothetical protein
VGDTRNAARAVDGAVAGKRSGEYALWKSLAVVTIIESRRTRAFLHRRDRIRENVRLRIAAHVFAEVAPE